LYGTLEQHQLRRPRRQFLLVAALIIWHAHNKGMHCDEQAKLSEHNALLDKYNQTHQGKLDRLSL
jgi:hypothetical protein